MGRSLLAVLAGAITWSVLWVASAQVVAALVPGAIAPDGSAATPAVNVFFLVLSVVYSLVAGYLTALIARRREVAHTLALGVVQLALGIYFEASSWALAPLWYHLGFLVLLVPANVGGGWLRMRRRSPT